MGRPAGFLWSFPGIHSMTVPYPDIDDFFFSGHVGTCMLLVLEYRAMGWTKWSNICLFVMLNQWVLMTFVRTHYIIDMIAGLFFAHYFHYHAEWASYFIDSKIMRVCSLGRGRLSFKPCLGCGFSNYALEDYCLEEEAESIYKAAEDKKISKEEESIKDFMST
jgi:hypothetical protein